MDLKTAAITATSPVSDKVRIKRAVEYFGLSESFFRHGIMNRQIPAYKLSGAIFVSLSEIESLISSNRISA